MASRKRALTKNDQRVSLTMLAEYLDLSTATISYVLNDVPGRSISEATRKRVREATLKFGYQPSQIARSLRGSTTKTIGVLIPELGEGYHAQLMCGVSDLLMEKEYFYFTVHHRHRQYLVDEYTRILQARGVDGIIAINTLLTGCAVPAVSIASNVATPGIPNVLIDQQHGTELALGHLCALGHRRIAFMQGPPSNFDSRSRWRATMLTARKLGLRVQASLVVHLDQDITTPEMSYPCVRKLLQTDRNFTAIVCFNDVSAIGAIRALHEAGFRVPLDVSVLGFDDIPSSAFQVPSLTTVRQPLYHMGYTGADLLLRKLAGESLPPVVKVEPSLVVRESTAKVPITTPLALRQRP
jgi:LacI family transcriptional regulator